MRVRKEERIELQQFSEEERKLLNDCGIKSWSDLWDIAGQNLEQGIETLSAKTKIQPDRLYDAFAAQMSLEIEVRECQIGKSWFHFASRHVLDFLLLLFVIGILVLLARALGFLPSALGFRDQAVIANHNLLPGRPLIPNDIVFVRLNAGEDFLLACYSLAGLVVARPVAPGRPLTFDDVHRLQVRATHDILAGQLVSASDVRLQWCRYEPEAATRMEAVINRFALRDLSAESVLSENFLTPVGPSSQK